MKRHTNKKIVSNEIQQGSTAFITHHVRENKRESYEKWFKEISIVCKSYPGCLDVNILRPIQSLTQTYTIITRFDTKEHLHQWMHSDDCLLFVEKVQPFLGKNENIFIKSGLDFWFAPEGAQAQLPKCWKQFLVTWSAIYPVTLVVQLVVMYFIHQLGIVDNFYFTTLMVTGIAVWAMVYVVMPRYTRLVQDWLFKG